MQSLFSVGRIVFAELPDKLERELADSRVVGGSGLPRGARGAGQRIAELVHGRNVGVVEKVEAVVDELQLQALTEVNSLRNAHIPGKEHGHGKTVAAQVADATERWSDARNGIRRVRAGVGPAAGRGGERPVLDERRGSSAGSSGRDDGGPFVAGAEVE